MHTFSAESLCMIVPICLTEGTRATEKNNKKKTKTQPNKIKTSTKTCRPAQMLAFLQLPAAEGLPAMKRSREPSAEWVPCTG